MNKNLFRRIIITALCLLATIVLAHIPLPFVKLKIFQGMDITRVSVGALGIIPYISAYIFLWVFTMIIPTWKRRWQSEDGENIFFHYALMLFVMIFSMLQALLLSNSLIKGGVIESGFISIIVSVILVAGVFVFIGLAGIINRKGIGQGFSLIFCVGIFKQIIYAFVEENNINDVLRFVELTVVFLVILIGFIILVTKIKWSFNSANKKIKLPFSIVGLFPFKIFGLIILISMLIQIINPKWVDFLIINSKMPVTFLIVNFIISLIISFFYLRRIIKKIAEPNEIISSQKLWLWSILWTLSFFFILQGCNLFVKLVINDNSFLNLGNFSLQIYVFIFTIITFMQQWRHRNWKSVFSHSDPAMVYAKAAELQQEGKEVCVVPTEGVGAAYGFIVGRLAERLVMTKEENSV